MMTSGFDNQVPPVTIGNLPPRTPPPVRLRKDIIQDREYSFETPPVPIKTSDIKESIEAEVVIVGAGVAGLSAALSAAEAGAKTILIEKASTYQARGHDNAFIGTRLQKQLGIEVDQEEVILNLMKYGANKPDQRLIRMWAEGSGETGDWVMDMTDAAGLKVVIPQYPPFPWFDNATEYYPQYPVTHQFKNERLVAKCLMENAIQYGVVAHFKTRARQLLRERKGRVTGVIAQDSSGDYIRFTAKKAVILCTGDYGNNAEMMAKYCPHWAYTPTLIKTSTGDGHQMAMWIGAVMQPLPHAVMTHGPGGPLGNATFLQVNLLGERFQNEDVPVQSFVNGLQRQPQRAVWQVFDSKYPEEVPYQGIGLGKVLVVTDKIRRETEEISLKANTIEELAEKMKLPVDTFVATVTRYNGLARLGKDLDFGKRPDRLTTIDKPPYYAGRGGYDMLVVLGGLNVNAGLQPLDNNWNVIPGLYVAGNTMGNFYSGDYSTMCPGLSHGMALHFGRLAGSNAASQP